MVTIRATSIDTWGFVDADSPEEKQFATYLHYWEALADVIQRRYGSTPTARLRAEFEVDGSPRTKKFRSLTATRFLGDEDQLRKLLLGGWNSELALYFVDEDDPRLMPQNQWNNVYAYYASSLVAKAWLLVRDSAVPDKHREVLNALAKQAAEPISLFPCPWNLCCTSRGRSEFVGFDYPPGAVSNLSTNADPYKLTAKFLKTSRGKRLDERVRQDYPRKRAPNGFRAHLDNSLPPTSIFDFLWRCRTRANYGDPSMFYIGTLDQERARRYLRAVRLVNSATMALFEILVGQRARGVVLDAAEHFISRDRTGITEAGLAARLMDAGLLRRFPGDRTAVVG